MDMAVRTYTDEDVIEMLRYRVDREGTQTALSIQIGITPQYLSDVLKGRRRPGPAILNFLGLEMAYTKSDEKAA